MIYRITPKERPLIPDAVVARYLALRPTGAIPPIRVSECRIEIATGAISAHPWDESQRLNVAQLEVIIGYIESGEPWNVAMIDRARKFKAPVICGRHPSNFNRGSIAPRNITPYWGKV